MRFIIIIYLSLVAVALSEWPLLEAPAIHRYGLVNVSTKFDATSDIFSQHAPDYSLNEVWQFEVSNQGMQIITGKMLRDSGMTDPVGADLCVANEGRQVATLVSNEGPFADGDYMLVYTEGFRGTHTRKNTYWVYQKPKGAIRMDVHEEAGDLSANLPLVNTLSEQDWVKEEAVLDTAYHPSRDFEHWFTARIFGSWSTSVMMEDPDLSKPVSVGIRLADQQAKEWENTPHPGSVSVGGVTLPFSYAGNGMAPVTVQLPHGAMRNGSNEITLSLGEYEFGLLRDLVVTYQRPLTPRRDGTLCVQTHNGAHRYDFSAWRSSEYLLDVTDPIRPVLVRERSPVFTEARVLFASKTAVLGRPALKRLAPVEEVLSDRTRQADYLLITDTRVFPNAAKLAAHRRAKGLSVAVVDLADIYREFGHGRVDPDAIRKFVHFATHYWSAPRPRFICLLGDGTEAPLDPKKNQHEIVPCVMGPGPYNWTARDHWYASVSGNNLLPDLSLGRLPFTQAAELDAYLEKVKRWERDGPHAKWRTRSTWVADTRDLAGDFAGTLREYMPSAPGPTASAFMDDQPKAEVRKVLLDGFKSGDGWVVYNGHGLHQTWSYKSMFTLEDATAINCPTPPVVTALACSTGAFQKDSLSISEALILNPNGAVAVVASTSQIANYSSKRIANGYFGGSFGEQAATLGAAVWRGRKELFNSAEGNQALQYFTLIGDPALIINSHEPTPVLGGELPLEPPENFAVSSTLTPEGMELSWPSLDGQVFNLCFCQSPDDPFKVLGDVISQGPRTKVLLPYYALNGMKIFRVHLRRPALD